ncbi:hypothetical protein [Blastococcus sp. PRF04-17]|uniref:hypothetical protein n=1 Tax=Blastococcus sp. PRF04-17 TaxID=2933797 RepID=UPI001FF64001|nr:hypothetical protein [Blastococcus sp. PRF04-17]UOY00197.1 hypothetical protein MVA48_14425 [Blastococcus sp. PRF04-17]
MTSSVRTVDPRTDPAWRALATGPGGSLFTSPPWITAVCDTYGFTPDARVLIGADGRAEAGLAWTDVRDLRGERRLALPFCDRADPVVADLDQWRAVSADALAGDLPFTLRALAGSPAAADPRFTVTGEAAWHRTSLQAAPDNLFRSFRPETRRNIAKAERSGVEVVLSADADAVAVMHGLHVGLRKRKYRLLAQPQELFDRIHRPSPPTTASAPPWRWSTGCPSPGRCTWCGRTPSTTSSGPRRPSTCTCDPTTPCTGR